MPWLLQLRKSVLQVAEKQPIGATRLNSLVIPAHAGIQNAEYRVALCLIMDSRVRGNDYFIFEICFSAACYG